ncbi:MAG: hypothetical protein CMN58_02720 [Solibacterales bacterium]|nr:hypothetical protein [Bryobacterales bacterium]
MDEDGSRRVEHMLELLSRLLLDILGISTYSQYSADCLVRDGEIVATTQEERFSCRKHGPEFLNQTKSTSKSSLRDFSKAAKTG